MQFVRVVVGTSIVLCNSVSADRIGMAASRFLAAEAVSVILLLRFASESPKSHCNGSMKVANGALAAIFHFGVDDFAFKILLKTLFKIVVFLLWRRDPVLELENRCNLCELLCVLLLCFATQCLRIALEWLRQGSSQLKLQA